MRTTKLSVITALTLTFAIVLSGLAFADNVKSDVIAGGSTTFPVDGSTTIQYWVDASNHGLTDCDVGSGPHKAVLTINAPAGLTATPDSLDFETCDAPQNVVFTASTVGIDREVTTSISGGKTGANFNLNPAKITLSVTAAAADTTNPVISAFSINDGAEWTNTTAVTVDIAATDNVGLAGSTLSNDPISGTSPATMPFAGVDVAHALNSGDGLKTVHVRVFDAAGNVADASDTIGLDTTPPTSSVGGVAQGGIYVAGQVPAATCTADDGAGSGVAGHGSATTTGGPGAGTRSVTCNGAVDNAGNTQTTASEAVTYTVLVLGSFNTNFDGTNVLKAKAGSAIPLKWALSNGTTNVDILDHITARQALVTTCNTDQTPETAESAALANFPGSSDLQRLDDASYQYNWKSVKGETGCRRITIRMYLSSDSSMLLATRSVTVNFTK